MCIRDRAGVVACTGEVDREGCCGPKGMGREVKLPTMEGKPVQVVRSRVLLRTELSKTDEAAHAFSAAGEIPEFSNL